MECEYAISTVEAAFLHVKVKVYFKVKVVLTILSVSLDFNPVSAPICVIKWFVYQARARNIFMPFSPSPPLFLCSLSFTLIIFWVVKSTLHGESHS